MAEFNRNQNGVFGEVKFEGNNNVTENTSYFEGTIPGANLANEQNNGKQSEQAGNIFGSFGISDNGVDFQPIGREKAITKQGLWSKVKAFLFQEIDLNAPINHRGGRSLLAPHGGAVDGRGARARERRSSLHRAAGRRCPR